MNPSPSSTTTTTTTTETLTNLLNALHIHIQSQTLLLPTLHAQLGLPQLALEDDLRVLQKELLGCVEVQVERRRKEVDGWMQRCEDVEKVCVRYTKALGGNAKGAGSSIGELRKEQALPRRFELVKECKERLEQVYSSKLEQLHSITNRLNLLSQTLGVEFFAPDILSTTACSGEDPIDPDAYRDVAPERFLKLEKELVRGKAEVNKRLTDLSATFVHIDWLHNELGISPPELDGEQDDARSPFRSSSSGNGDPFLASTPTPASRAASSSSTQLFQSNTDIPSTPEYTYRQTLAHFISKLHSIDIDTLPDTELPLAFGLEDVEPTQDLITWALDLQTSLEDTKRRRESRIQNLYDQLEGLWRRMGVSDDMMDAFVDENKGSTEVTVRAYEEELGRMVEMKRESLGMFVDSARLEIGRLWEELMVGEQERGEFGAFGDDEYTEELLTIHEDEITRLKAEKRSKAPLLSSIKRYFDICAEEKELLNAASDQSRLTGRGPRDPGRLLREEKMRKRVQKEKPRLEQQLLTSIPAWEDEAGRQFLVDGEPILQILLEKLSACEEEKENSRGGRRPGTSTGSGRAGSVPARATTPTYGGGSGYALGQVKPSGTVTPAVRTASHAYAPDTSTGAGACSVPNKRQRVGENTYAPRAGKEMGTGARVPLGGHRSAMNGARGGGGSPSKRSMKSGTQTPATLGRSASATVQRHTGSASIQKQTLGRHGTLGTLGMVIPKPGTAQHALGHGRVPTSVRYGAGVAGSRSASAVSGSGYASRVVSGSGKVPTQMHGTVKSTRTRESFRPRPSLDALEARGAGGTLRLVVQEGMDEYA